MGLDLRLKGFHLRLGNGNLVPVALLHQILHGQHHLVGIALQPVQGVQKFRFFLQLTVLTGVQRVQRGIDAGKRDIDREIVGQNEHQRQHHRKNHHNHHLKQAALGAVQHGEHAGRVVHHNIPVIGLQLLINVNPSAPFSGIRIHSGGFCSIRPASITF